jgi:hypothetical protein
MFLNNIFLGWKNWKLQIIRRNKCHHQKFKNTLQTKITLLIWVISQAITGLLILDNITDRYGGKRLDV